MLTDFRDANLDIIVMARDTDASHQFVPQLDSGSTFIWAEYDVVCEGRLAIMNETKNFTFVVSDVVDADGTHLVRIDFPKTLITSSIRESKIYWRVLATDKTSGNTILLKYGEVWLK